MAMRPIIYFIFSIIFPGFIETTYGQSQGPNNPSAAISTALANGKPWSNPTNVFVADNINSNTVLNVNPTCTGTTCFSTTGLAATGFGFSIPGTAVVSGIVVEIKRGAAGAIPNQVYDSSVMILQYAVPVGIDHASATAWTTAGTTYNTYGSSTDLWGSTWTPADINDVNFGVLLMARNTNHSISPQVNVDHIRITVYYSFPSPLLFVGFDVVYTNNSVKLNWETTLEQKVSFFEIEKSDDGNIFYTIGKTGAQENSSGINQYTFEDFEKRDSLCYYRIKEVDENQQFLYSEVKTIHTNPLDEIIITTTNMDFYHLLSITSETPINRVVLVNSLGQQEIYHSNKIKTGLKGILSVLVETTNGYVVKKLLL
jgi:hypothetical protein